MLTSLYYLGTAMVGAGIGFVVCGVFFTGKYSDLVADRDNLLAALLAAGARLRATDHAAGAAAAFTAAEQSKAGLV